VVLRQVLRVRHGRTSRKGGRNRNYPESHIVASHG